MQDDSNGSADVSGGQANKQIRKNEEAIARAHAEEASQPDVILQHDGASNESQGIIEASQVALHQEYEGILPHPSQFNEYSQNAQEALLEIAREQVKAAFIDESKRQDRIVDAEIEQGYRGQIISGCIVLGTLGAAASVAICTGEFIVPSLMASIPLATIIGNIFPPIKSRSSHSKEQPKEKKK